MSDLHIAEHLLGTGAGADRRTLERLGQRLIDLLGAPAERPASEFVKASELPALLGCSRTSSWKFTKTASFPRPLALGPKLRLWRRAEVIAWRDAHQLVEKRSPEAGGPGAGIAQPRGKRGMQERTTEQRPHDMPRARPRASRRKRI